MDAGDGDAGAGDGGRGPEIAGLGAVGFHVINPAVILLAAGYAPDYVDGYVDGYSAGCHTVGHPFYRFTRDTQRYEADGRYKNGWEDGFSIARTDYAGIR